MALELPSSINETLSKSLKSGKWNTKTEGIKINDVNKKRTSSTHRTSNVLDHILSQSNLSSIADNALSKALSKKITGFKPVDNVIRDLAKKEINKRLSSIPLSNIGLKEKDALNKLLNILCSNNGILDSSMLKDLQDLFNLLGLQSIFCKVDPKEAAMAIAGMLASKLPNNDIKTITKSLIHAKKIDGETLLKVAENTEAFKTLKSNVVSKAKVLGKTAVKKLSTDLKHLFKSTVKKLHNNDEPLGNDPKFVEVTSDLIKEKPHQKLPVSDTGIKVDTLDIDSKDYVIGKLGTKNNIA